jgi:hypothetical protein
MGSSPLLMKFLSLPFTESRAKPLPHTATNAVWLPVGLRQDAASQGSSEAGWGGSLPLSMWAHVRVH